MSDKKIISIPELTKELQNAGISPSIQRIKILKFVSENDKHSSVDLIYHGLLDEIPTLSKTTVYNTLGLFAEKGIINSIVTNNTEVLYEHSQTPHAHFQCRVCNNIFDVELKNKVFSIKEIDNHLVEKVSIHLQGVCRECLKNKI